jgi:hypothetical protein
MLVEIPGAIDGNGGGDRHQFFQAIRGTGATGGLLLFGHA